MDSRERLKDWAVRYKLKPQEITIVDLVIRGINNTANISKTTGLKETTIKNRLRMIFRVLNVQSKLELAVKFYRETHVPK